jgi:hypothetical protein
MIVDLTQLLLIQYWGGKNTVAHHHSHIVGSISRTDRLT